MKILGLTSGSTHGNSELLLTIALNAASTANPSAKIDLIRIPELSIPKTYRTQNATQAPTHVLDSGASQPAIDIADDRPFILDLIMEADVVICSAPVYTRAPPGILKFFQDMTLGPFQDVAAARKMLQEGKGELIDERVFRPRVAGLIVVGGALGSEWASFGLPMLHQVVFPIGTLVVDQMQVYGKGIPGSVVLDAEAVARAEALGRNCVAQASRKVEEREYLGGKGLCPICHLNCFVFTGGDNVDCATCGAKGRIGVVHGKVRVSFTEEGRAFSVETDEGKEKHIQEIAEVGKLLGPRMKDTIEKRKELDALSEKWLVRPPSSDIL